MNTELEVDLFFSKNGEGVVVLSEYGMTGTNRILEKYSAGQIKDIANVSRSALKNYVAGANGISKRGEEALIKLTSRYNRDLASPKSSESILTTTDIGLFSDKELLEELKNRGFNVFISV